MSRPLRILVVDDNTLILRLLALVLEEVGFEVVPAESAEVALVLVRADPPDLLVADHELPGLSGADLVRSLRWSGDLRLAAIPVVGVSAYPQAERALREAGAAAFVRKPLDEVALLEAVLAALSRGTRDAAATPVA